MIYDSSGTSGRPVTVNIHNRLIIEKQCSGTRNARHLYYLDAGAVPVTSDSRMTRWLLLMTRGLWHRGWRGTWQNRKQWDSAVDEMSNDDGNQQHPQLGRKKGATSNIPPRRDSWHKIEHFIEVNQESSVEPDQRTQKGDHPSSCASHRLWDLSWIIAVLLLQPVDQDHVSLLRLRRRGGGILLDILLPCIVLGFSLYPVRLAGHRPLVRACQGRKNLQIKDTRHRRFGKVLPRPDFKQSYIIVKDANIVWVDGDNEP
jgi:hypothetical protein